MDLRDYVRVLRVRWRLVALCIVLGLGLSAALTWHTPKAYRSSTQVIVAASGGTSLAEAVTANQYIQQRINSYRQFVASPEVTERAAELVNGSTTASSLASRITTSATPETVLMSISVTAPSPRAAREQAGAVTRAFIELVEKIEPGNASQIAVSIVRPAGLPGAAYKPKPKANALVGLLLGAFIGVVVALAREALDTRIASPDSLESKMGLATLGVIGFDSHARRNPLITMDSRNSVRSEAYRRLRTNLRYIDVDHGVTSLVITSSVPGEGKTTTACNLAVLLAEAGVKVVLVDGDLRRPRVADFLGLEGSAGLTDVLIGRTELSDVLQPWGSSGRMFVLPSGPLPPNPSEVLGSAHMATLVEDLEDEYFVIIDAPPLLPVTDGAVLAGLASGALLVVRARSTAREQVATAAKSLADVSARLYGAVFNMAPTKGPDAYAYRYGYYRDEYSYYREDTVRRRKRLRRKSLRDDVPVSSADAASTRDQADADSAVLSGDLASRDFRS